MIDSTTMEKYKAVSVMKKTRIMLQQEGALTNIYTKTQIYLHWTTLTRMKNLILQIN